jgi:hypothetical protein
MWAGMTSDEIELVERSMVHHPSGLSLKLPPAVQYTAPPGPYVLAPASPARWLAELYIDEISDMGRAYQMKLPSSTSDDLDRFRRRFGSLSKVERVVPVNAEGAIPWDPELITIIAKLYFVKKDYGGYLMGHPAFPDKLEFCAPGIPPALRRTVVNPFARPVK